MRDSWRRRRKEEESMQAQKLAETQQQQQREQLSSPGAAAAAVDISTLSIRPPPLAAKATSPRIAPSPLSDRSSPSAGATTATHYDSEPDQATCRGLAVRYSRDSDDEDEDAVGDEENEEEIEGYGEAATPYSLLTLHGTSRHDNQHPRGAPHGCQVRHPEFPRSWSSRGSAGAQVEIGSSLPDIHSASTYQVDHQVESFFAQGVAAVDPFLACPIAIGPQQEALLQWCKSLSSPLSTVHESVEIPPGGTYLLFTEPLSADSIGMGPFAHVFFGRPTRPGEVHPLKEICAEDFHSAATMNVVLACSALHKSLHTGEDNSFLSMHHKAEGIRLLNEQLANPSLATSDANIATVIRLLCIEVSNSPFLRVAFTNGLLHGFNMPEYGASTCISRYIDASCLLQDWWGSHETYNTHMKGLELMIRCRGGIDGLRSNWRTECHYLS